MARVNIYVPDDLADQARAAGINVSSTAQEALRRELAARRTTEWLKTVRKLPRSGITHREAMAALDAERAEAGDDWPGSSPEDRGG